MCLHLVVWRRPRCSLLRIRLSMDLASRSRARRFGLWAYCFSRQASGVRHRASGIGLRVSGFGHRASGIGLRASGFGHIASGIGLREERFMIYGSGFTVDEMKVESIDCRGWEVRSTK